jgi:putative MATE family efflux protein
MTKNLTKGTEWKTIFIFALPMMGSGFLQVLYTFVDSVIVGNFVGPTALGAIGICGSLTWLLVGVSTGIGIGTSIVISQYIGEEKYEDVRSSASTALILAGIIGIIFTALCFLFAKPILWGPLGTPKEMQQGSYIYLVIYGSGMIFQMFYNVTYGILRAHGDSKSSLIFLLVAAILHIVLDLIFVILFKWGVAGAVSSTIISQAGSAIASFIYMWKYYPQMRFKRREWACDLTKMKIIFKLSIPIILQTEVLALGFLILQRLVNSFGPASIEGFTAMRNTEQVAYIPSNAFNAAIASFAGQNIGAKKIDRVMRGYRSTVFIAGAFSLVMTAILLIFDKPLLGLFNITDAAMVRAVGHLDLLACFMVVTTINNVTSGLLQGAGDVKIPAMASFINLSIRLVVAYAMSKTAINFRCIYYSLPPAWIAACIITVTRYRSGKWKTKAIS